jgi:hypothetical protein
MFLSTGLAPNVYQIIIEESGSCRPINYLNATLFSICDSPYQYIQNDTYRNAYRVRKHIVPGEACTQNEMTQCGMPNQV